MERTKLKDLLLWYKNKRRKPLIVWGARQVGKTYLVKDLFAKKYFKDYIYIDLKKDDEARTYFSTTANADKYLSYIEARYGKKISNDLPLIFDEVQQCLNVLSSLKYFNQDHKDLPIIVTGSLVRLSIQREEKEKGKRDDFLFPVGQIDSIEVYPFNFEEYLLNTNKVLLDRIRMAYKNKKPLESYEHELAQNALYEFLAIGGMPEVISVFLDEKSYVDASSVRKEIYDNYISDMDTYNVSNETILKTRNIYKNIYNQLNKENKNFKITQIEKGRSNRDYFNAYQWLELAKVVYRSKKKTGKVTLPIIEDEEGSFRLYLSDPGMFAHQSKVSNVEFFTKDKMNTLSGVFYESYVADEFSCKGIPLYYWVGKNTNEFEFIVEHKGKILPIDVKKKNGKLNSLDGFRSFNAKSTAIKISSNNFGYDANNDILTIPLYEVFLLADDIINNNDLIK